MTAPRRRPFWLSRWAGGRPPEGRPPAQRETPFNNEAGSEWSRRSCRGATGTVAPVAIFSVCFADTEILSGALLGGPCTAHASGMGSAGAPRGPTTPVPAILCPGDGAWISCAGRKKSQELRRSGGRQIFYSSLGVGLRHYDLAMHRSSEPHIEFPVAILALLRSYCEVGLRHSGFGVR
ncbi:hypothetical protein NDU88_004048 [Pleurodeles waltl]|uniref:Uncharacterized protein n=1 Tax=Pleurodeles waltl TaxID=8319 RepID=A0AAV7WUF3_PLEWA|nr:hypothetical protein NDU88_004048 [Pleurodeles waltl]